MYALIENNQFTRWANLRQDYPNTSFPSVITDADLPEGVVLVHESVPPTAQAFEVVDRNPEPVLVNGVWQSAYTVRAMTPEEAQAKLEQIQNEIVNATQQRLDDFAATRNYSGILSACTYATSAVPRFASDGQYCVDARDATWAKLYEMLAEVQAGTRPVPTSYADVEPELPVLEWPAA